MSDGQIFSVRLDPALRRRIDAAACRRRCSAAKVIRAAIEAHLGQGVTGDRAAELAEMRKYLRLPARG